MRPNPLRILSVALLALCALGAASRPGGPAMVAAAVPGAKLLDEDPADLARAVRPILARACFACHGPDEEAREARLRLDRAEDAFALRRGRVALKPGSREGSHLWRLVTSPDPEERMPPVDSGRELSSDEIELLGRWIDAGAPYGEHWAFVAPRRPAVPSTQLAGWAQNPVDAFVLERLEREGLSPAPEADRHALARRLSLALTGLPPTPELASELARDEAADALERYVERLLASPAYGERWASVWLDLARYADSTGYGSDPVREISRYRDWVIEAYDRNLPYDRFTIEQLAGDLLEQPSFDQLLATAFHRNTMTNTEGGTDNEQFRVEAVKDRASTTSLAWMGLTMACAQCHDHKLDPISQREYYSFHAFFDQSEDSDRDDDAPRLESPQPDEEREMAELDGELARIEAALAEHAARVPDLSPEEVARRREWEREQLARERRWIALAPRELSSDAGREFSIGADGALVGSGAAPDSEALTLTLPVPLRRVTALRLEALARPELPSGGPGLAAGNGNFVVSEVRLEQERDGARVALPFSYASATFEQEGYAAAAAIDGSVDRGGWAISPQGGRSHALVLELAEPLEDAREVQLALEQRFGGGHVLGALRVSFSSSEPPVRAPAPELLEALALHEGARSLDQQALIARTFAGLTSQTAALQAERRILANARNKLLPTTTPILRELPPDQRRTTHVLYGANFLAPGEAVEPGTPSLLHPFPADQARNRLGLAHWLVAPENPLTARVLANRLWAQLFGAGLVETLEDFGSHGSPPSHPELLDWLAVELQENGWDQKALLRLLVLSATFRQSAAAGPELLERDPRNRLHARGPRFRLPAEMVRDQALFAAGLLSEKRLGPSVFPPQPANLWRAAFNDTDRTWETSTGEDRYRRALYTFWRRTIPYPSLEVFDMPSREVTTPRRIRTNTPLQALTTLNDPAYVEAAQALARRMLAEAGPNARERAARGLALVLARPAQGEELDLLIELFEDARTSFAADPEAARRLAEEPLGPAPHGADPVELAAWTLVANVLLNLDAALCL